ncbi:MAG TPA: hypothetical protein VGM09_14055, partial [Bradyrhizobium sp.]
MSKGIFGAALLSVTFGAVASGRDLVQRDGISPLSSSQLEPAGTAATINRAAKADRGARVAGSMIQTQTVALRLNDLANTSVLIRIPVAREARNGAPASLMIKSGEGKPAVACEPVVSVLTEVAK